MCEFNSLRFLTFWDHTFIRVLQIVLTQCTQAYNKNCACVFVMLGIHLYI
jgi:hypothetical protein